MNLTPSQFKQLSDLFLRTFGLSYSRSTDLTARLKPALKALGFSDPAKGVSWLLSHPLSEETARHLANHLTIGETYFYRDSALMEFLETKLLPSLIQQKKPLSIWSAGCSSGEEIYTVAMILHRLISSPEEWRFFLYGTDINTDFIQKARRGKYTPWSFRNPPSWLENFFTKDDKNHSTLGEKIRSQVAFSYLNLSKIPYFSPFSGPATMDMIFCRNVFLYFSEEGIARILQQFNQSLREGGILFVSPAEHTPLMGEFFAKQEEDGVFFYQKTTSFFSPFQKRSLQKNNSLFQPDRKAQETLNKSNKGTEKQKTIPSLAKNGKSFYNSVREMYQRGHYGEAARELKAFLSKQKDFPQREAILLVQCYQNQKQPELAIEWCEKILARPQKLPWVYYLQALVLDEQGEIERAQKGFQKTIYLDPQFVMAYFGLATILAKMNRPKEAKKNFQTVLSLLGHGEKEVVWDGISAGELKQMALLGLSQLKLDNGGPAYR